MAPVSMPPVDRATELFRRLGYTVSGEGTEFRARRKWRTVHVTVLDAEEASSTPRLVSDGGHPDDAPFRCYVTWKGYADEIRDRLAGRDIDYEWAVLGVESAEEYEVYGV
ncbi:MAG: hypothetical protein ABEH47_00620 [Haloferacaceae archaeon]